MHRLLSRSCGRCHGVSQRLPGLRAPRRPSAGRPAAMAASTSREVISTAEAPAALGPYSQAVRASGTTLFVSGQLGLRPGEKSLEGVSVEEQADQALKNMGAILAAGGASFSNVVKTTVLLADMGSFAGVNEVYGRYFKEDPPARACFAVKTLPLNALVEIEAVAVL